MSDEETSKDDVWHYDDQSGALTAYEEHRMEREREVYTILRDLWATLVHNRRTGGCTLSVGPKAAQFIESVLKEAA
jgi:S-adenosylmethionine:tRNA-ribosyltransferase-isomerase (queuine synthetase)